jgi:hypothetical protein
MNCDSTHYPKTNDVAPAQRVDSVAVGGVHVPQSILQRALRSI